MGAQVVQGPRRCSGSMETDSIVQGSFSKRPFAAELNRATKSGALAAICSAAQCLTKRRSRLPFPSGTRIQKLLEVDGANANASVDLMNAFDPATSELFEQTAGMFQALIERAGKWPAEAVEDGKLSAIAGRLGLTDQQLIDRLRADPHSQPDKAQTAWARLGALRAIEMLILSCQRY